MQHRPLSLSLALLSLYRLQLEGKYLRRSRFIADKLSTPSRMTVSHRLCHFNIGLYQSLTRDWVINSPISLIFLVRLSQSQRSLHADWDLLKMQYTSSKQHVGKNQVNKDNYLSRLLSFIDSCCAHLAGGCGMIARPLLFVFKSVQQKGLQPGQQHKFQVSASGTAWASIMWNSFPVSCFMPPEAKAALDLQPVSNPVLSVTIVKKCNPLDCFLCARWTWILQLL